MSVKRIDKNGRIIIPKEVRKKFPPNQYFDIRVDGNRIVLIPVRIVYNNGKAVLIEGNDKNGD